MKSKVPTYIKQTAGVCAVLCGGLIVTHIEEVPHTGRKRLMFLSRETERRLGEETFKQVLMQHKNHILPPSHPKSKMVRRVGKRIAHVVNEPDFKWEFVVIDSPEANAFCVPGGKVCVFTGLFKTLRSEDGLASVMGHEIAHAVARHSAEQMSLSSLLMLGLFFLPPESLQLAQLVLNLGINLPYSRKHESEADEMGMEIMAKACYDPRAAPQIFSDWEKQKIGTSIKYLSTHPPNAERSASLSEKLKQPLAYYKTHCGEVQLNFLKAKELS